MAITPPTTQETADGIVSEVEGELGQSIPLLERAFTRVLAKALAGAHVLLYKYIGWMSLQLFVRFASDQPTEINGRTIVPLDELGALVGVGSRSAATRAELELTVTVTSTGGTIAAGSQLVRTQTGVVYLVLTSESAVAPSVTVQVRAYSDQDGNGGFGTIGNLVAGDELQFVSPLPNVVPTAVVASATVTAADAETTDAYRTRILDRFRSPPQGGARSDYRIWGLEPTGIIAVYPYAGNPGEVDVYCEATVASSGSEDGVPTDAQLAAVFDAIQLTVDGVASRRPISAAVNALPISRSSFDVVVNGLDVGDVPAAQAAITAAISDYMRSREPYIVGLSTLPRLDRITQAAVSGIVDDVASALGATVASVELQKDAAPILAFTLGDGEKAKSGVVSFV